jgi:hypothetical protein
VLYKNTAKIQKLPKLRNLLTYLLHGAESFSEKLTGLQLVKKFPAFYGTRRFITAFTSEIALLRPNINIRINYSEFRNRNFVTKSTKLKRFILSSFNFNSEFPTKRCYAHYDMRGCDTVKSCKWVPKLR